MLLTNQTKITQADKLLHAEFQRESKSIKTYCLPLKQIAIFSLCKNWQLSEKIRVKKKLTTLKILAADN